MWNNLGEYLGAKVCERVYVVLNAFSMTKHSKKFPYVLNYRRS